jgi:hypothetical protein
MKAPQVPPQVPLVGMDGNAFNIIGKTVKAFKKAGADKEYIDKYMEEAMSGDYDHLLGVTMEYVEVV